MQSLLQYRRIKHAVLQQVKHDPERILARPIMRTRTPLNGPPSPNTSRPQNEPPGYDNPQQRSNAAARDNSMNTRPGTYSVNNGETLGGSRATQTCHSSRAALGYATEGITIRARTDHNGKASTVFVVGWESPMDPLNPRNHSHGRRILTTVLVAAIAWVVGLASSIDVAVVPQASSEFGVSHVVESMTTGMILSGIGIKHSAVSNYIY